MTAADIADAVEEHAASAKLALDAGFDAIELHAANGCLIEQFLKPLITRRTDAYGGHIELLAPTLAALPANAANAANP